MFDVEDIVKLSSLEELEKELLRVGMRLGSSGINGQEIKLGSTGVKGARFFWRLLTRGARINFWM